MQIYIICKVYASVIQYWMIQPDQDGSRQDIDHWLYKLLCVMYILRSAYSFFILCVLCDIAWVTTLLMNTSMISSILLTVLRFDILLSPPSLSPFHTSTPILCSESIGHHHSCSMHQDLYICVMCAAPLSDIVVTGGRMLTAIAGVMSLETYRWGGLRRNMATSKLLKQSIMNNNEEI